MPGLQRLDAADLPRAIDLMARAFADDPLFRQFAPEPHVRRAVFAHMLRASLPRLYRSGPDLEAVALWEGPGESGSNIRRAMADLRAAVGLLRVLGVRRAYALAGFDAWAAGVRERLTAGPHWHLVLLATDPMEQGRGHAWRLVRPMLDEADRTGLPAYLETHNPANVGVYERYGFTLVEELAVPGTDLVQRCMLRRPARAAVPAAPGA